MNIRGVTRPALILVAVLVLTACGSNPPAPVVDRSYEPRAELPVDGLYSVHRGDTLHGIAFKYGLDWREIARWNAISAPYTIFPDQVLRLNEPPARQASSTTVQTRAVSQPRATTRSAEPPASSSPAPAVATAPQPSKPASKPAPKPPPPASTTTSKPPPATSSRQTPTEWAWPANGPLYRTFKAGDPTRKGIDIVGKSGDPVRATAAGDVVYSGNGLIGYGELVIVKHSDMMLSAYAHNRRRIVQEGDRVSQGQVLAEMGSNDQGKTVLHFEIRRAGQPVDPLQYLPSR
ncbi:peptidoglycan DD-metalloendopeptidase family protein [Marinihelvus fidelis]|uniref:Peptidoglycan DD-metalloendopeptidase family protein n=1 Tax=Marinihelvus fidelis TaxID=2613842 RepID=A0A5N0TBU4_9GAMM|nr:peptidoglycan DD-metalloendopeptidase family protein [Marinihelvus fidelis]KAA9132482.1 peptidoglycan DD-metalloendopeptidase family protein [Marinihelvus fidelis]